MVSATLLCAVSLASFPVLTLTAPTNFTLENVSLVPCPFKIQATAAKDLSYLDIIYSTKGSTPNSLASYGPSISSSNARKKCYVNVDITYPREATRVRALRVDLSGSARLDAGLVASIETSLTWGQTPYQSMANFSTATISGPTRGPSTYDYHANLTSKPLTSTCDYNGPTVQKLHLANVFSIHGDAAANATGVVAEDGELKERIWLEWIDQCEGFQCKYVDRYGTIVYIPPFDAETCSD